MVNMDDDDDDVDDDDDEDDDDDPAAPRSPSGAGGSLSFSVVDGSGSPSQLRRKLMLSVGVVAGAPSQGGMDWKQHCETMKMV